MWELGANWTEVVIRAAVVYIFLLVLFRLLGKKQLGEMSPMDLVLLLIVSESVNGALLGADHSIPGGLISAFTLIGISFLVDVLAFHSKTAERWIEGTAQLIVSNGKIIEQVAKAAKVTRSEILESLRQNNVSRLDDVDYAVLETNGKITVIKKADA